MGLPLPADLVEFKAIVPREVMRVDGPKPRIPDGLCPPRRRRPLACVLNARKLGAWSATEMWFSASLNRPGSAFPQFLGKMRSREAPSSWILQRLTGRRKLQTWWC
jgi:hypothetical protein